MRKMMIALYTLAALALSALAACSDVTGPAHPGSLRADTDTTCVVCDSGGVGSSGGRRCC